MKPILYLLIALLLGSCTMEKRKYTRGFYFGHRQNFEINSRESNEKSFNELPGAESNNSICPAEDKLHSDYPELINDSVKADTDEIYQTEVNLENERAASADIISLKKRDKKNKSDLTPEKTTKYTQNAIKFSNIALVFFLFGILIISLVIALNAFSLGAAVFFAICITVFVITALISWIYFRILKKNLSKEEFKKIRKKLMLSRIFSIVLLSSLPLMFLLIYLFSDRE